MLLAVFLYTATFRLKLWDIAIRQQTLTMNLRLAENVIALYSPCDHHYYIIYHDRSIVYLCAFIMHHAAAVSVFL